MKDNLLTNKESKEGVTEKNMSKLTKNHKKDMEPTKEEKGWMINQAIKEETKSLNKNVLL